MRLDELGEFGAIDAIRRLLEGQPSVGAVVAIGDDAAAWRPTPGCLALQTTDMLVEGVHFSLDYFGWEDLGWKAMAVNVSDIAAMGGKPRAAFVSMGLKPDMAEDDVRALYRGLAACAAQYGVAILGGDTVISPAAAVVNIALFGETVDETGNLLRRDTARAGDVVAVTGPLGASAGALLLLQKGQPPPDLLLRHHLQPAPRVVEGQQLLAAGIRCGMDVSDGLVADLGKLCKASGLGAVIDFRIGAGLVDPELRRVLPDMAERLALTGGEDYELLVCGPAEVLRRQGMIEVGRITTETGVHVINESGDEYQLDRTGYDAFLPHRQP